MAGTHPDSGPGGVCSGPVRLVLHLDFAVCGDLCVPMTRDLSLALGRSVSAKDASDISMFRVRVPRRTMFGGDGLPRLVALSADPGLERILATVRGDGFSPVTDVILEAPSGWYVGFGTAPTSDGQGNAVWQLPIEQKPSSASLAGQTLTVTVIAGGAATETEVTLDASGAIR